MNIIHTNFSCWASARLAFTKIRSCFQHTKERWVGLDAEGDIVAGGESSTPAVLVSCGEDLERIVQYLEATSRSSSAVLGRSTDEIDALAALVQRFEAVAHAVGPDTKLYEPTVHWMWLAPPEDQMIVHFAAPTARERVEAHVARGCTHCRRPRYATPEQSQAWDAIAAWQRRWESTGLSAAEAALWTDLVGCRPDVAIALRASGLTAIRLQSAVLEWITDATNDVTLIADELLPWVRSGYSWPELEKIGYWAWGTLDVERELRARGFDRESCCRPVEVGGSSIPLCEFLDDDLLGQGRPMKLDEKLAWLEETGRISAWGTELA